MAIWKDGRISIEIALLGKLLDPNRMCEQNFKEGDIAIANVARLGQKSLLRVILNDF